MELLRRYITENGLTQSSFATLAGLKRQDVNGYYHGRLGVSKNAARKMAAASGGALTIEAILAESLEIELKLRKARQRRATKSKRVARKKSRVRVG